MTENTFRNELSRALWHLAKKMGLRLVHTSDATLKFDQDLVHDLHLIRSGWPQYHRSLPPESYLTVARKLLQQCRTEPIRNMPPMRLVFELNEWMRLEEAPEPKGPVDDPHPIDAG